jgi:hypothetical protein
MIGDNKSDLAHIMKSVGFELLRSNRLLAVDEAGVKRTVIVRPLPSIKRNESVSSWVVTDATLWTR